MGILQSVYALDTRIRLLDHCTADTTATKIKASFVQCASSSAEPSFAPDGGVLHKHLVDDDWCLHDLCELGRSIEPNNCNQENLEDVHELVSTTYCHFSDCGSLHDLPELESGTNSELSYEASFHGALALGRGALHDVHELHSFNSLHLDEGGEHNFVELQYHTQCRISSVQHPLNGDLVTTSTTCMNAKPKCHFSCDQATTGIVCEQLQPKKYLAMRSTQLDSKNLVCLVFLTPTLTLIASCLVVLIVNIIDVDPWAAVLQRPLNATMHALFGNGVIINSLLCCGCGRADEPLHTLPENRIGRRIRVQFALKRTEPLPWWEEPRAASEHFAWGVEHGSKLYCSSCCSYRDRSLGLPDTMEAQWPHAWPSIIGFLLGTDKAGDVWTVLPPKVRHQWRGLCVRVHYAAGSARVHDAHDYHDEPLSMHRFHVVAAFPGDTKCAICRWGLHAEEVSFLPYHRFRDCQWMQSDTLQQARNICMFVHDDGTHCINVRPTKRPYCFEHQPLEPGKCGQRTANGTRCRRPHNGCPIHGSRSRPSQPSSRGASTNARSSRRITSQQHEHVGLAARQRCNGINKRRGRPCNLWALFGSTRCHYHQQDNELPAYLQASPVAGICTSTTASMPSSSYGPSCSRANVASQSMDVDGDEETYGGNLYNQEIVVPEDVFVCVSDDEVVEVCTEMEGGGPLSDDECNSVSSGCGVPSMSVQSEDSCATVSMIASDCSDAMVIDSEGEDLDIDVVIESDVWGDAWEHQSFDEGHTDAGGGSSTDDDQHSEEDELCEAENGPAPEPQDQSPERLHRQRRQRRPIWLGCLAPCWDVVAQDPLLPIGNCGVCTRAFIHPIKGLVFAVCAFCAHKWWAKHFFSAAWPESELRDAAFHESDSPVYHAPVHQNLSNLAPVRIGDVAISGMRLGRDARTGRRASTQYQLLGICGDGRGISTQFVTFRPKGRQFVIAPQTFLWRWMHILYHQRPDLEAVWKSLWGPPGSPQRVQLENHVPLIDFVVCPQEAQLVASVKRRRPPEREERAGQRVTLCTGAPGWVMPRTLPRTPKNAITAAIHALLQLRSIRAALVQPTDATLDVYHPIYETLSGIFTRLLRPKKNKPQQDEFEELKQLLTMEHGSLRERQLTRSQMECAFTVLDTLLTRVHVRTNVGVDLPTLHRAIWPHRMGLVLPPAFSSCALRYHVPQQVPQDILVCCEQRVTQMTIQERLAVRGPVLLVQVDATTATDDVPIRLGTCFLGRYHLRAMVFSVAGEWSCLVPGRVVNGNAAWFECGVFAVKTHEIAQWVLPAGSKAMLVLEAARLSQGVDMDVHDGNRWMHREEEAHGEATNCANSTIQSNNEVDSEDEDTQSASNSSLSGDDQPTVNDVSAQLTNDLEAHGGDSGEVDEDDILAAEELFLAATGGEADALLMKQ